MDRHRAAARCLETGRLRGGGIRPGGILPFADPSPRPALVAGRGNAEPGQIPRTVGEAVAAWQPQVIVPGDDLAVQVLHRAVLSGKLDEHDRDFARLVREALSDPTQFGAVEAKSRLIELARSLGIRAPAQLIAPDVQSALAFAGREGFPVILKPDLTQAGKVCASAARATSSRGRSATTSRPGASPASREPSPSKAT